MVVATLSWVRRVTMRLVARATKAGSFLSAIPASHPGKRAFEDALRVGLAKRRDGPWNIEIRAHGEGWRIQMIRLADRATRSIWLKTGRHAPGFLREWVEESC